jgi:hypothetical protein
MEDIAMSEEDNARRIDLTESLIDVLNKHVTKYKTEFATKEIIFIMAQIIGLYSNLLEAPDDVMEDLHRLIDKSRVLDTSKFNIRHPLEYQ